MGALEAWQHPAGPHAGLRRTYRLGPCNGQAPSSDCPQSIRAAPGRRGHGQSRNSWGLDDQAAGGRAAEPGADQTLPLAPVCVCRMGETSEYFTDWNESYDSFDQMQLHEQLLRGIYAYGACGSAPPTRAGAVPAI